MSATAAPMPALGVGRIIGESFAIFFRRIVWFTILGFLPLVVVYGLLALLVGGWALQPTLGGAAGVSDVISLVVQAVQVVVFSVAGAFMVMAAYDAKLARPVRLGDYLVGTLRQLVPLVLCSVVIWIGFFIAAMALVVPGLWLLAVWSVAMPAIVIEGAGFSSLGRSAALTKGYRWPIVGAMILLAICMGIITMALVFLVGSVLAAAGGVFALVVGVVLYAVVSAAGYGIFYIGIALIYARLREIKEGTSVETLAEVFA